MTFYQKLVMTIVAFFLMIGGLIAGIFIGKLEASLKVKEMQKRDQIKLAFCKGAGFDTYSDFGLKSGGIITIKCIKKIDDQWAYREFPPDLIVNWKP